MMNGRAVLHLGPLAAGLCAVLGSTSACAASGTALSIAAKGVGGLLQVSSLGAVTHLVTNCADDPTPGSQSLRDIVSSPSTQSGDTVDLSPLLLQSCSKVTLTNGEIVVNQQSLTIQGPSSGAVTVAGDPNCTTKPHCRVFNHNGSGTLTITGLTIADGTYSDAQNSFGGCIRSAGPIFLNHATITGCTATSTGSDAAAIASGGGLRATNGMTLLSSVVSNNMTSGLHATGGGLESSGGQFVAKYSAIENNTAVGSSACRGGGIDVFSTYSIILGSTIAGNAATAGNAAIASYGGGEIFGQTQVLIADSTISGNSAKFIGGLDLSGTATFSIANSTVADNHANYFAGVYADASLSIMSSIIANNTASGEVANQDLKLRQGVGLPPPTGSNNLIISSQDVAQLTSTIAQDPKLSPLQLNGGRTRTHALLSGSPAIGTGNNSANLATDQRGKGYPRTTNGIADIGAFQFDSIFADGLEDF